MKITTFGLDLAKNVFQLHWVEPQTGEVKRRALKRDQMIKFFAQRSASVVAMEACGSAHYWARKLIELGHEARLIAPQFVRPFVRSNKTDAADAAALLAQAGITLTALPSTNLYLQGSWRDTPLERGITRLREARTAGVRTCLASDNVADAFFPYGVHDPLEAWALGVQMAHLAPAEDWLAAITVAPAQAMRLAWDGRLAPGCPADFVLLAARDGWQAMTPAGRVRRRARTPSCSSPRTRSPRSSAEIEASGRSTPVFDQPPISKIRASSCNRPRAPVRVAGLVSTRFGLVGRPTVFMVLMVVIPYAPRTLESDLARIWMSASSVVSVAATSRSFTFGVAKFEAVANRPPIAEIAAPARRTR